MPGRLQPDAQPCGALPGRTLKPCRGTQGPGAEAVPVSRTATQGLTAGQAGAHVPDLSGRQAQDPAREGSGT